MLFIGLALMTMNPHAAFTDPMDNKYFCPDFHPQSVIDMDSLMGVWYILEIFHHKREEYAVDGAISLRVCPTIHIGRESRSDFRLIWNEPSATFYYKIRLENPKYAGTWISSGPHNESSTTESFFTHFTGTIQVMKAVNTHVVLTFCTTQNHRSLFSVLLSRDKTVSKDIYKATSTLLQMRNMETFLVKYTCSGGPSLKPAALLILVLISAKTFF